MSCAGSHWGEIQDSQRSGNDDWSLSASDMEDLLTPKPMPPTAPTLHQPSPEETPSFQILPGKFCRSDPLVLQTIQLLQYQRQVAQLIARAQTTGIESGSLPFCPAPPDDLVPERKTTKPTFLNFIPPERTPFTVGKNQPQLLEVEGSTARLILRKAVATVCAHTGYTDTTESVLKVLTDVTHDFLSKLTGVLRANTDNLLLTDRSPFHEIITRDVSWSKEENIRFWRVESSYLSVIKRFVSAGLSKNLCHSRKPAPHIKGRTLNGVRAAKDVVEQTLHDVGIGSMTELHKMYHDRILQYHARVQQESSHLYNQYQSLVLTRETSVPTPGSRRESTSDWWAEDTSSQHLGLAGVSAPGLDDASVPSIKSTSSLDPELSLHPFSVLSQVGADGEDVVVQNSPVTTQQYQLYPLTPR